MVKVAVNIPEYFSGCGANLIILFLGENKRSKLYDILNSFLLIWLKLEMKINNFIKMIVESCYFMQIQI